MQSFAPFSAPVATVPAAVYTLAAIAASGWPHRAAYGRTVAATIRPELAEWKG